MENDRWPTDDVVFDEVMQILVSLIEDGKERICWKVVEQIEQCQTRNANSVFEHIDVLLLIEGKPFIESFKEGNNVAVIVPNEKIAHRRHSVVAPRFLT